MAEGKAKQQEIKRPAASGNEGRLSLAQDKIAEMEKQLEDKVTPAAASRTTPSASSTRRRDEVLDAIEQQVMPVINQVGKERGYTLIFNKFQSGLVFADEAVDITADDHPALRRRRAGAPGQVARGADRLAELAGAGRRAGRGATASRLVEAHRARWRPPAAATSRSSPTPRYREQAAASRAGALLVGRRASRLAGATCWSRDDPYLRARPAARALPSAGRRAPGVHPTAVVGRGREVDPTAHVGPLGGGRRRAAGSGPARWCSPHAVVGRGLPVGEGARPPPPRRALRRHRGRARGVDVHAGAVLGADGFGYATARRRPPQGAAGRQGGGRGRRRDRRQLRRSTAPRSARRGSARAPRSTTWCRSGTTCGSDERCILCGQAGIAGSDAARRRRRAGRAGGVAGHLELGDGVQVAAKSAALDVGRRRRAGGRHPGGRAAAQWRRQAGAGSRGWRSCEPAAARARAAARSRRRAPRSDGGASEATEREPAGTSSGSCRCCRTAIRSCWSTACSRSSPRSGSWRSRTSPSTSSSSTGTSGPAGDARRAAGRGHGAGGRHPAAARRARPRREAALLHGHRAGPVPPAGGARRPGAARGRGAAPARSALPARRQGAGGRQARGRGDALARPWSSAAERADWRAIHPTARGRPGRRARRRRRRRPASR